MRWLLLAVLLVSACSPDLGPRPCLPDACGAFRADGAWLAEFSTTRQFVDTDTGYPLPGFPPTIDESTQVYVNATSGCATWNSLGVAMTPLDDRLVVDMHYSIPGIGTTFAVWYSVGIAGECDLVGCRFFVDVTIYLGETPQTRELLDWKIVNLERLEPPA